MSTGFGQCKVISVIQKNGSNSDAEGHLPLKSHWSMTEGQKWDWQMAPLGETVVGREAPEQSLEGMGS